MERFTVHTPEGGGIQSDALSPDGELYRGPAADRLAAFESMAEALAESQRDIAQKLEDLRAGGKKNSVKFKELLGTKLNNSYVLMLMKTYGIEVDD